MLLLLVILIVGCQGYDRELDFDNGDCDEYNFYDLTQYQSYLVEWNGTPFTFWCIVSFHGKNVYNVETKYRVCFKTLDYNFDKCDTTIRYIDGLLNDYGDKYDCNNPPPEKWCTETDDYGKLKIITDYKTKSNSRLKLEVTVTADVSLTIAGALGIAFGCIVFLGIATTVCIVCVCRKNQRPYTTGRIVNPPQNQGTQQLTGYPTQGTEANYSTAPSTFQPQFLYTPQSNIPSSRTDTQNAPSNYQNQEQYQQPSASAPPPAYESLKY